jgi:hypothetical protein
LDVHRECASLKPLLEKTQWEKILVKEKEYNIICVWTASLKTLPGKPNGIKPWLREKECRTQLYLPLMKTIISETEKLN